MRLLQYAEMQSSAADCETAAERLRKRLTGLSASGYAVCGSYRANQPRIMQLCMSVASDLVSAEIIGENVAINESQ